MKPEDRTALTIVWYLILLPFTSAILLYGLRWTYDIELGFWTILVTMIMARLAFRWITKGPEDLNVEEGGGKNI